MNPLLQTPITAVCCRLSLIGLLLASSLMPVMAEDVMPANRFSSASTVLKGNALSGVNGAVNINMTAGDNNLQNNSGAIALGEYSSATNVIIQQVLMNNGFAPNSAAVRIKDNAFDNAIGWISVNQAAGQSNVQSNTMGVALGIKGSTLSDDSLGQVVSKQQVLAGNPDTGSSQTEIEIEESTFSDARGVIQVNQSAGKGNATRNSFSLRVEN